MKPRIQKVSWAAILMVIGLLSLTVMTAAEGLDWTWSSDPGTTETGFDQGDAPAAGSDQTIFVDWEALTPEDDPDQSGQNIEPSAAVPQYFRAAGSTLRPRNSSYEYASDSSGGCLYLTSGDPEKALFNIPMSLPDGAIIKYFRVYYYDKSTSVNGSGWITRYDNTGNSGDVWILHTSGDAGYGAAMSTLIDHEVDTVNYSYVLNWRPRVIGENMRVCGLRVNYIVP